MGDKIIMYDSPEAGRQVTVTVWEVDNPNGIIYTKNEASARWNNCTHRVCECGKIREKHYTKCEDCRIISQRERYLSLPYKEWDLEEPVVTSDGSEYFFDIESLCDYMEENEIEEIDLLICEPIYYTPINSESFAPDSHDDWEPDTELEEKVKALNDYLKTLPAHSWYPGKVRTNYKIEDQ